MPRSMEDNITQHARLGYHAGAHAQSLKAAKGFVADMFKLN